MKVASAGSSVTLRATAPDPDGNQTSVKFRIYKYDTVGLTAQQYCATMQESDFDDFKPSGEVHSYTFTNLSAGTYKWSAISRDTGYKKSEGGSMFCYSSSDQTTPLYGFAYPRVFTVEDANTNHRPYINESEMVSVPNAGGTSVTLKVKGYDADGDNVKAYFRVREKVTGNCVLNSGISSYSDSDWTSLQANGSELSATISGLKSSTTYQWSVKLQDARGMSSQYSGSTTGLSFCGGTEWFNAKEFTTLAGTVVTSTTTTTTTKAGATTTTTISGQTKTKVKTWDYCKDSTLSSDCSDIFTSSLAVPFFDPNALDAVHKLNAFFVDLSSAGSIGSVPNETSFITLEPGSYQFQVRAATDNSNQNIRLSAENSSGTFASLENVSLSGSSSSLQYGYYTFNFNISAQQQVRLRIRKNDNSEARIMVDRYELYKIQ